VRGKRLCAPLALGLSLALVLVLVARWQSDTTHPAYASAPAEFPATLPISQSVTAGPLVPDNADGRPNAAGRGISASGDLTPQAYLPLILKPPPPIYLPLVLKPLFISSEPLPPPIPMTGTSPIDFETIRAGLLANGQDLAFAKIGFHVGPSGNVSGLCDALAALDAAGVPFFIKSVDTAGSCFFEAHGIAENSSVPHTLVYRKSGDGYDVPNYALSPHDAAVAHWNLHKAEFPPELDPSVVWIETINEVDKEKSEWLAEFALETAELALADGYRWAAFAWSSGEPEPDDWEGPQMLEFLRLVGEHPDRLAIALHEYSYTVSDIADGYPYKVGRFQFLFQVCDAHNIPRPTVLITEWGWEYQDVPDPSTAMDHIAWASWLYAAYPQVRGAAIWYLGGGAQWGGIADQAQLLIVPWQEYALSHYFIIQQGQGRVDPELFRP
jgi:hypothetical protein